jgi:triosephosphate isomerase (TIM)
MEKRKLVVAGNWKLNKTTAETRIFVKGLVERLGGRPRCDVIIAPPFVCLQAAVEASGGSPVNVAAQNVYWEDGGAYTGEVSGVMLKEVGCSHVIIGHSERRRLFGETNATVNLRLKSVIRNALTPIVCVGETIEEREAGRTFDVVESQLTVGLQGIDINSPDSFLLAYEPVWAIGTGRTATPEQAQEVHAFIRGKLADMFDLGVADRIRILYGGSVTPENFEDLTSRTDVDGGLIGGASLKLIDFLRIVESIGSVTD